MAIGRQGVGILLVVVASIAVAIYLVGIFAHGEIADKEKYSLLQGIEYKYRAAPLPSVFLLRNVNGQDSVLGLKTMNSKFPRSWIILNRLASTGKVARMPEDDNLDVKCDAVLGSLNGIKVLPSVKDFLSKSCKN